MDDTAAPTLRGSVLFDQIAEGVARARQLTRLTIELRPPDLGALEIAVESRDGRLQAHFHASHPAIQSWLAESRTDLRSYLEEAGLVFEQLTFSGSPGRQHGGAAGDDLPQAEAAVSDTSAQQPGVTMSAQSDAGVLSARLVDRFA